MAANVRLPGKSITFQFIAVRFGAVLVLAGTLAAGYFFVIRPHALQWGATADEVASVLPDDQVVKHPAFDATRAITIRGQPEDIWPWLVQMGYHRAGFYGYDLIENIGSSSGLRSADAIVPALQHPEPGDRLPISAAATLVFGPIDPDKRLVWLGTEKPPDGVYIWALVPMDAQHTRLISRIRWRYQHSTSGVLLGVFTEFGDSVAVREILRGVRDRVEGREPKPLWMEAVEMASWFLALLELGAGFLFVLRWQRWMHAWIVALGAGVLVLFVLYSSLPVWATAPLPWLYLGAIMWQQRRERWFRSRILAAASSSGPVAH
jgi:hypothetical protein